MSPVKFQLAGGSPRVAGSFGGSADLCEATYEAVVDCCDLIEIRLDLLAAEGCAPGSASWSHLAPVPMLFTARRQDEGGALAMDASKRMELLLNVLDHAACIDIEVASIVEMSGVLEELARREIPWIASWHDFEKLPATSVLAAAASQAFAAGAAAFKAAALLDSPADLARLAEFQMADHGLPVATMGMGPLAPVSRLLCAQAGSVLNYGYLGTTSTAPGQWESGFLKTAISRLAPLPR